MKNKKTSWINKTDIKRDWYVLDAKNQILGRFAVQVAKLLIGKHKTNYVPNMSCGDNVIVINSADIKLTRGKEESKIYYRHSGFMGNLKQFSFKQMMAKNPNRVIELAVKRMLPVNKLTDEMMARLHVYADANHKHEAQKPIEYKL